MSLIGSSALFSACQLVKPADSMEYSIGRDNGSQHRRINRLFRVIHFIAVTTLCLGVLFSTACGVIWLEGVRSSVSTSDESKSGTEEEVRVEVLFRIRVAGRIVHRVASDRILPNADRHFGGQQQSLVCNRSIFPASPHDFSNGVGGPLRC
jgi:hypothetical protein